MTRSEKMAVWTEAFIRKIDWEYGDPYILTMYGTAEDFIEMGDLWWAMFLECARWGDYGSKA